jgi:hypothetical protein
MRRSRYFAAVAAAALMALAGPMSIVASARAHGCCARTNYACAGLRTPDDCCKSMGHSAGAAPAGLLPRPEQPVVPVASIPIDITFPALADVNRASTTTSPIAKRLYDPPHLHTFVLLI